MREHCDELDADWADTAEGFADHERWHAPDATRGASSITRAASPLGVARLLRLTRPLDGARHVLPHTDSFFYGVTGWFQSDRYDAVSTFELDLLWKDETDWRSYLTRFEVLAARLADAVRERDAWGERSYV